MTTSWLRAVPETGVVAIYRADAISADIENNPLDHLDVTSFNSKLAYVGHTKVTKTYTIPARSSAYFAMERVDLGAHGKSFTPICFAVLRGWVNGDGSLVDIPLGGGVLLDFYGQRPGDSGVLDFEGSTVDRWSRSSPTFTRTTYFDDAWEEKSLLVGAGADGDNLFLWYEQSVRPKGGDGASYPAIPLTIDFYVGDQSIDFATGDAPVDNLFVNSDAGVFMSAQRLATSGTVSGGFDSNKLYLFEDTATPLIQRPTSDAVSFVNGGTAPDVYVRDAFYYGADWSFDLKLDGGATIPAIVPPTLKQVSV